MDLKSFTLPLFSLLAIAGTESCQKRNVQTDIAKNGMRANKMYECEAPTYDKPTRMFTAAGEITDPAVIAAYQVRKPLLHDTAIAARVPPNVWTTQTDVVYYGVSPYKTTPGAGGVMNMSQQDTSSGGQRISNGSIDFLFNEQQRYLKMRDQILELRGSLTLLERQDDKSYRIRERFQIQGSFNNGVLRLPFTFIASRYFLENYPFPAKAGVIPTVAEGDTLLIREGHLDLK